MQTASNNELGGGPRRQSRYHNGSRRGPLPSSTEAPTRTATKPTTRPMALLGGLHPESAPTATDFDVEVDHLAADTIVELYLAHRGALLKLAHLVAPEDGMAEDLVQEAFVRLYRSRRKIKEPAAVNGYLRTTVLNLARGRGRRIATARRKAPDGPDAVSSAEDRAMVGDDRRAVIAAMRNLPARQRQCLVLRHYEGMTETQIAETLGISVGSVRTHTHRGTTALEQHLEGQR